MSGPDTKQSEDPLENAAVGETRAFEHEYTVDTVMALPRECYGSDRDFEVEVADFDVVPADHPDDPDDVQIRYKVKATKRLPRNWDTVPEVETAGERRRKKWFARLGMAVSLGLPLLVTGFIADHVVNSAFSGMTINGEPVGPASAVEIWGLVVVVGILASIIYWAVNGGIPPRMGVKR